MKKIRIMALISMLALSTFLLTGCKLFTIVKNDQSKGDKNAVSFYFADNSFDASKFIETEWDGKIVPTVESKSAEMTEVIKEMSNNLDDAGKKYGLRSGEQGNSWNFLVKGKGKILNVNKESRNGYIEVDLLPCDEKADIRIQVGPVIKGTSVRDSMEFIKFDDYKNQMVFAEISSAINKWINEQIVSKMDFTTAKGKEVEFAGAFTADSSNVISITPVKIQLSGGGK
jgi:predicted lipoprotein